MTLLFKELHFWLENIENSSANKYQLSVRTFLFFKRAVLSPPPPREALKSLFKIINRVHKIYRKQESVFIYCSVIGRILDAEVAIPCKKCQEVQYILPEGNQF